MKKILLTLVLLVIMLSSAACTDKPGILFNKYPITKDTVMGYENLFKPNTRIYYLVILPKPVHSRYIYIQIIKKDNAQGRLGYKLYYGNTVRLKDEQVYYYDDYIVINEPGIYVMKIYSKDNPTKVLTMGQFFVQN